MNAPMELDTERPEAAVFGEWNTTNLGDRGIHQGVQRFLEECGWRTRSYGISTLTPVPEDSGLQRTAVAEPSLASGMLEHVRPLKRVLRGTRQRVRMAALSPRLAQSQAIVVGGGALLSDVNLHFPQSLLRLVRSARSLGKPLVCLGCGIEGDWSARGRRMIVEFLSSCDVISVRDSATAARLEPMLGATPPVFGDFCLREGSITQIGDVDKARRAYAINVSQLPGRWAAEQARYEDALVALILRLARRAQDRQAGIRIFTTGTPEDARAAQRVFSRVEAAGMELHLPDNLAQLLAMLRTSELVISTRLHAAILGLAQHAPVIGFSASPKLSDFFSTLGLRRCAYGVDDESRLSGLLDAADFGQLRAEQRRALLHAPIWAERARVRRSLGLLAEAVIPC